MVCGLGEESIQSGERWAAQNGTQVGCIARNGNPAQARGMELLLQVSRSESGKRTR